MGLADFGIFSEPYENVEQYEYLCLGETEEWILLTRADDPCASKEYITPKDLKDKKLIFPWRLKVKSVLGNWFGSCFSEKNIIINCNLHTNAAFMVAEGLGYYLTMGVARNNLFNNQLVAKPLEPPLRSETSLVWLKHKPLTPTAACFLEFARKYLEQTK